MLSNDIDENDSALIRGAKATAGDGVSYTGGIGHSDSGIGLQRNTLGDNYDIAATSLKSVHFSKAAMKRSKYHLKFPSLNVIQPKKTSFIPSAKSRDPACIIRYDETPALRVAWRLHNVTWRLW